MNASIRQLLVGLALVSIFAAAESAVSVDFVDPERFADAIPDQRTAATRNSPSLSSLKEHLLALGARCIRPDQLLDIRVRDVDLAGDLRPAGRPDRGDVRVLRDANWPKIKVEYVWRSSEGRILAQGTELISDPKYLRRGTYEQALNESLFYEKQMLTDWFESRFCRPTEKAAPN